MSTTFYRRYCDLAIRVAIWSLTHNTAVDGQLSWLPYVENKLVWNSLPKNKFRDERMFWAAGLFHY